MSSDYAYKRFLIPAVRVPQSHVTVGNGLETLRGRWGQTALNASDLATDRLRFRASGGQDKKKQATTFASNSLFLSQKRAAATGARKQILPNHSQLVETHRALRRVRNNSCVPPKKKGMLARI